MDTQNQNNEQAVPDNESLDDFLKHIALSKKVDPLIAQWIIVGEGRLAKRYSFASLKEYLTFGHFPVKDLAPNLVILGDGWYIKEWILHSQSFQGNTNEIAEIEESDFERDTITPLFRDSVSKKIPSGIYFCDDCDRLLTEAERKKSEKYLRDHDGSAERLCEFCLETWIQMDKHPEIFSGSTDEEYEDDWHGFWEKDD